jgi:hypothetical protein
VQVPALGAAYNPSFRVKGGSHQGGKGGKVTIIPTSPTVELSVYSSGTFIGKQPFRVKQIPKPELVLRGTAGELNLKSGIDNVPRRLTYQAVADEDFAQFLPNDAKYRVTKWEVILARGTRPLDTKRVNGPNADLSDWVSRARPGDRIVVEAKEVQRMNFKGQTEVVKISPSMAVKSVTINK